jgi:predicted lysophospholipase L1 biosynthesis ABC-type transport system permease subunit
VIVSESIERRFFPGGKAVGRRVRLGKDEAEIVGVVGDIRRAGLSDAPRADMYFPFEHSPSPSITLFLKTTGDPGAAAPVVRSVLRELEPSIVLIETRSLGDIAAESMAVTRLAFWLLGVFALVALTLAGVGVYGVMSYAVRQRTHEIGTRLALGATHSRIARMVLREGAVLVVFGLFVGLAGGLIAARSLGSLLYGVPATDPATIAGVVGVLGITMAVACLVPARRAALVDPAQSLTADS